MSIVGEGHVITVICLYYIIIIVNVIINRDRLEICGKQRVAPIDPLIVQVKIDK